MRTSQRPSERLQHAAQTPSRLTYTDAITVPCEGRRWGKVFENEVTGASIWFERRAVRHPATSPPTKAHMQAWQPMTAITSSVHLACRASCSVPCSG
jgi:hypothetical protein